MSLRAAPPSLFDRRSGLLNEGSFLGRIDDVSWPNVAPLSLLRRRRAWTYVFIAHRDVALVLGIIDLGVATSLIAFALDRHTGNFIDRTGRGVGGLSVGGPQRLDATFSGFAQRNGATPRASSFTKARYQESHQARRASLRLDDGQLVVRAELALTEAPVITAVRSFAKGSMSDASLRFARTEKAGPVPVTGVALVQGKRISLDGAYASIDVSDGLPPSVAIWKWLSVLGVDDSNRPVLVNVCDGYIGEHESALLGEHTTELGAVELTPTGALGDGTSLQFAQLAKGAVHREQTNIGPLHSHLEQRLCSVEGHAGGHQIKNGIAIVEAHNAKW